MNGVRHFKNAELHFDRKLPWAFMQALEFAYGPFEVARV